MSKKSKKQIKIKANRQSPVSGEAPDNLKIREGALKPIIRVFSYSKDFFKVETVDVNAGPLPPSTPVWVGSVYSQVEPSMAFQFGLPLLLVREEDTDANNGIWAGGIAPLNLFIVWHSETQTVDQFFRTAEWRSAFENWSAQVRNAFYIQTEPKFKYRCD